MFAYADGVFMGGDGFECLDDAPGGLWQCAVGACAIGATVVGAILVIALIHVPVMGAYTSIRYRVAEVGRRPVWVKPVSACYALSRRSCPRPAFDHSGR